MLQDAAAGCAEYAGAVSIVDIEHGVPACGEVDQIRDRGDVAVLAEHAIRDDDFGCGSRLAQQLFEMIEIEMAIGVSPGARQAYAFANADVVILVAEIRVGVLSPRGETEAARSLCRARQRGQNAEIGQISGGKQDRMALAFGTRDLAFEFTVEREVAAEQPRIAVADTVCFDAANGGGSHARTCCESQIVVGTERHVLSIFHLERRDRKAVDDQTIARRPPPEPIRQLYKFIHVRLQQFRPPPRMHGTLRSARLSCRRPEHRVSAKWVWSRK